MTKLIKLIVTAFALCLGSALSAQQYTSLDPSDPIEFGGSWIVYQGQKIELGEKAFFIDGRFSDAEAAQYPFVFNSINEAAEHLTPGSFEEPMVLYIAPWVYWIDDPDDPAVREGAGVNALVINCPGLRFFGLSRDPYNVVMCCNRGQTLGSRGNYTLFRLLGDGITAENVTFANYCNIDLVYPLNPSLNRPKRASAIVQAQLIYSPGDKIFARNCNFLSRLNLMPFLGAKRLVFDHCHFESTDDALSTGIYHDCTFEFHNKKPFGGTSGTGAVFLGNYVKSFSPGDQYFTKMGGPLVVIDTRMEGDAADYVGWRDFPTIETRNYEYNFSFNGEPYKIGQRNACSTVELAGKPALDAFRYDYFGQTYYNIYNLTAGTDGWDPMCLRERTEAHQKALGRKLIGIPTQITVAPTSRVLETGVDAVTLKATVNYYGGGQSTTEQLTWSVADGNDAYVTLKPAGYSCEVIPANETDDPRDVTVEVRNAAGIEGAAVFTIMPSKLPAPGFSSKPRISIKGGSATVDYKLASKLTDQSVINWYTCSDRGGADASLVAVTRLDNPLRSYSLRPSDVGSYIMCTVSPKHQRCDVGEPVKVVSTRPVRRSDVSVDIWHYSTDFQNIPVDNQPETRPGAWTFTNVAARKDSTCVMYNGERNAHNFAAGEDGAAGYWGLLQTGQSMMYYTPYDGVSSDVDFHMLMRPFKFEGQGFSVAWMWADFLVDFDPDTFTGYGVRLIRTTKYHDAIDCIFIRYENGLVKEISDPVSTTCFRPDCDAHLIIDGNVLKFKMSSTAQYAIVPGRPEVKTSVDMQTRITPSGSGIVGVLYAGGAYTMISEVDIDWKQQ